MSESPPPPLPTTLSDCYSAVVEFLDTILDRAHSDIQFATAFLERRGNFDAQLKFLSASQFPDTTPNFDSSLIVNPPSSPTPTDPSGESLSTDEADVSMKIGLDSEDLGLDSENIDGVESRFDSIAATAGTPWRASSEHWASAPAFLSSVDDTNTTGARHLSFPTSDGKENSSINIPPSDTSLASDVSREEEPHPPSADEKIVPIDILSDTTFILNASGEVDYDASFLGSRLTLHDFLLTRHISRPIPESATRISPRPTRGVELKPPELHLKEIVFLPNLGSYLHKFLSTIPGEDLEKHPMDSKTFQRLLAGATVANCSLKVFSEADVEYHFRVFFAHIIAEYLNLLEGYGPEDPRRYYPRKGKIISGTGQSHAFADVEIDRASAELKTYWSINHKFISRLLDVQEDQVDLLTFKHDDAGFKFDFKYPTFYRDMQGSATQPIIQLWNQLHEKQSYFAQGSSHEFSFFAIKDPGAPQRLYISSCYSAFSANGVPQDNADSASEDPTKSLMYTMYSMYRIANKPEYAEDFLKTFRQAMSENGRLIPVHYRDFTRAGEGPPPADSNRRAGVNLLNGTVGVVYYDQPATKDGALRANLPKPSYIDISNSRVDESTLSGAFDILDPTVAVAAPVPVAAPVGRETIKSRIPRFQPRPDNDIPVEPPQTRAPTVQLVVPRARTRSQTRAAGTAPGPSIAVQPTAREPQQGARPPRRGTQAAPAAPSKPSGLKGKGKQGPS
ncbi:hypothetical protein C8R46DRAFT_1353878 [Mycena filopes]|nr:hypothetical protein C8R46DRAFT_1353878 [Mycena filopes]